MADDFAAPVAYEIIVVAVDQAPLLARPHLARLAIDSWWDVDEAVLRACAVFPTRVHALTVATDPARLHCWVDRYKAVSEERVLAAIRRYHADDLLDRVTFFSPVWPGVVYRVWQDGYHSLELFSETSVLKRINSLRDRGILYANCDPHEGA